MSFLGIDTSNYTTSAAVYDPCGGTAQNVSLPLPVPDGGLGLRQSDALFHNIKQLPLALSQLDLSGVEAVGVSTRPRSVDGSYMPCFLAGESVARSVAHALDVPLFAFSHQQGHIAAAAWSSGHPELLEREFLAWHMSGGTTELLRVSGDDITVIGATRDISAGQLIDRVGKMLGLPFPAGQALDGLAAQHDREIPVKPSPSNLSGYENKAASLLAGGESPANVAFYTISAILRFIEDITPADLPLLCAGGVMCNSHIRAALNGRAYFAKPEHSRDNAVGAAYLSYLESLK